jgi:ABC-type antimicrobial peptide transport system permease subunit
LGETSHLLLIGICAGLAVSWASTRLVRTMLYGLSAHDARVFLLSAITLIVVALIAASLPAKRAVQVDPMVALRYE